MRSAPLPCWVADIRREEPTFSSHPRRKAFARYDVCYKYKTAHSQILARTATSAKTSTQKHYAYLHGKSKRPQRTTNHKQFDLSLAGAGAETIRWNRWLGIAELTSYV